jgi:Popeye protein conserved region
MSVHPADYLVHFSNLLLLVAYSVRDILWLRWFAVAAALTNIPYFLVQGTVLWPPVLWALVFTAINLFQITRIYLERRPVVLSKDEQALYDLGFRSIRPREFVSLSLVGEWKNAQAGERIVTEGQPVSHLCIAITGSADVHKQRERIGTLSPGHIIGTALALTGDPSPVNITFIEPAHYMRWSLPSLRRFMDKRPDLRVALQALVNRDLAGKVGALLSP